MEPLFKWDNVDTSMPLPVVDGLQEEVEKEDSVGLLHAGPGPGPEVSVMGMWPRGPGVCLSGGSRGQGKAASFGESVQSQAQHLSMQLSSGCFWASSVCGRVQ